MLAQVRAWLENKHEVSKIAVADIFNWNFELLNDFHIFAMT